MVAVGVEEGFIGQLPLLVLVLVLFLETHP
jgi:hypothetical protein